MVALNFNSQGIDANYGGGDPGLPDGRFKVAIVNSRKVDIEKMGQVVGAYLELTLGVLEGPLQGKTQVDRLNLQHSNPQTVEIANKQLAAYCHVTGVYAFQDTAQLHNRPFFIEVGRQIDKTTKQPVAFGEVKKLFDLNGNEPGKGASGAVQQQQQQPPPQQPPPAGVQPDGGGWGGGPPPGVAPPQGPPAGDPNAGWGGGPPPGSPPPAGQNWGASQGQQAPPQQPPQQQGGWQPQQQGGQPPGWGR